ncbi:NAD(P)-dependent oxidoreductase [Alkalibacillus haloalkaliphilus]|uniref:3-hydroxyisobutyrate dehydrogenase n=1 Tax=Alkalibacillus haloalkaliphilus TaxID=94136 RepID=A0A511W0Q5_9BACI|nr:NAD(P)-dependent oxidoreductase [Alkalibacillus haloalkaliphilus]GEN44636.1 3-hydroxyisobutyrate dehydrogenase [Alkalibacillus haloalkaliphilus]
MSKKIGFVGLGAVGFPMAVNLKKAGFEVIGYDAFKGVYEKAEAEGITMVETLKEVADQSDEAIISMVRDYDQNVEVIFGTDGLFTGETKGKTVTCMSTLDPDTMKQLNQKVEEESDLNLIDAGVSGGVSGAEAGTLSIMVSGPENIVTSFQPYFEAMGSNIFYYGNETGNSQIAKLINNLILGINTNAVAEGLKLAKHFNLPEDELLNLLQVSTGDSWVVRNWSDVSEWTADTTLNILLNDLTAANNQGLKHHVPLPFSALATTQLLDSMGEAKSKC